MVRLIQSGACTLVCFLLLAVFLTHVEANSQVRYKRALDYVHISDRGIPREQQRGAINIVESHNDHNGDDNKTEWAYLFTLLDNMTECDALREYYEHRCNDSKTEETRHCRDVTFSYRRRCGEKPMENKAMYIVVILLILLTSVALGNILAKYRFPYLPESGMCILVGVVGAIIAHRGFNVTSGDINEDVFFLYLLPPIIFQSSAFAPSKTLLFANLPTIIVLAVVGTVMCMLIVGLMVFAAGIVPVNESLLWGSLISAVDPIAVLAVFSNYGIDPQLSCIVFGESMANDGVAVVLYQATIEFLNEPLTSEVFKLMLSKFCSVFFGSTAIGLASGLIIAFITRHISFHHGGAQSEMVAIICLSFIPYYVCQALEWSGIVGLMFEALVFELYTWRNISLESKQHLEFSFEVLASLTETTIFVYLGFSMYLDTPLAYWNIKTISVGISACILSRLIMTFSLIPILNMFRIDKVPLKNQFMFWYSGLRGAIGFALVTNVPRFDPITQVGSKFTEELNVLTASVILFTVFVQGGLVLPVMQYLQIEMTGAYAEPEEEKTQEEEDEYITAVASFSRLQAILNNKLHLAIFKPIFVRTSHVEMEVETQYFTGFNRPERRLSPATFNIMNLADEQRTQRRLSMSQMQLRCSIHSPMGSPKTRRRRGLSQGERSRQNIAHSSTLSSTTSAPSANRSVVIEASEGNVDECRPLLGNR
eukprot:CFRG2010T1